MFGHKSIPSREGGVEIVVEELATRMVNQGHQVTCYNRARHHKSEVQYRNYKGIKIRKLWTINCKGLAAMTSSLFAALCTALGKYDVVHIHAEGPAAMCAIPHFFGKKVVVTIHGLDWARSKWGAFASKYIKWGERQAVRYADEIIVLSKNCQEYFIKTYNRETVFIPNGISPAEKKTAHIIKKKWGLDKDSYFLFVGRLVPEKGIKYLIEVWNDIHTEKKLVVVGDSSDTDSFVKELKAIAGENVLFTGSQQGDALAELFSNAYVYVLPSELEGMPLSLLEAMSYGNCCLVSDIPELTEVVNDKGVVFQKSNRSDLKKNVEELLDYPEKVERYKSDTRLYITEKYQWDRIVNQTLELYSQ